MRRAVWVSAVGLSALALGGAVFRSKCGFYSIQPIGALPEGSTAIVWREDDEQFFESPDARCLRRLGHVSLMCRGAALGAAPTDRILFRLPYQEWAYLASTDGREFASD